MTGRRAAAPWQTSGNDAAAPGGYDVGPLASLADLTTPMAIRVVATLRLPDRIAGGTTRVEALAEQAGADADALRRLLRYLACRGVFAEREPGCYALTDVSRLLLDDHPSRMRARLAIDGATGRADLAFARLLDTVRTGEPAFPFLYGRSFWEDLDASPRLGASFEALMAANASRSGLDTSYDWSSVGHVVDVGGGTGTLLAELLQAHPHLHGTLVDLPSTVAAAREKLAAAGLSERCDAVAGSFFDPLPPGGDVYVLCRVLHDWDDAEALAILRRCAEAAGACGRVLVVEMAATGEEDPAEFTHMDLRMLAYMGGRERTLEEFHGLARRAGLDLRHAGRGKWGSCLLEASARDPA